MSVASVEKPNATNRAARVFILRFIFRGQAAFARSQSTTSPPAPPVPGGFGTTKKPVSSGSSDTRSTPENVIKIPDPILSACHQLWGHPVNEQLIEQSPTLPVG